MIKGKERIVYMDSNFFFPMVKLYEIFGKSPKIHPDVAYISENAIIEGDVEIGKGVTIFDNVVIEGFPMKIKIGDYSNIQSGTVIHGLENSDTIIGKYCTIGHRSILHGCTCEDYVTIGLGSTIMGRSLLKKGVFVGSNALVTEKKIFEERSLILGAPAKFIKQLSEDSIGKAKMIAETYAKFGEILREYRKLVINNN